MEVRSLRVFEQVLLLELSMNVHTVQSRFSIFNKKHSFYSKRFALLNVRDICIHWNNVINVRKSCVVLTYYFPVRTKICCQRTVFLP
jgi:hypothetical protein